MKRKNAMSEMRGTYPTDPRFDGDEESYSVWVKGMTHEDKVRQNYLVDADLRVLDAEEAGVKREIRLWVLFGLWNVGWLALAWWTR